MDNNNNFCPTCGQFKSSHKPKKLMTKVECDNCGTYFIASDLVARINKDRSAIFNTRQKFNIQCWIHDHQHIQIDNIELLYSIKQPPINDRCATLVKEIEKKSYHLGHSLQFNSKYNDISLEELRTKTWCINTTELLELAEHMSELGYLKLAKKPARLRANKNYCQRGRLPRTNEQESKQLPGIHCHVV